MVLELPRLKSVLMSLSKNKNQLEIGKCYAVIRTAYFWELVENNTLLSRRIETNLGEIMIFLGKIGSFYNVYYFNNKLYSPMTGVSENPQIYLKEVICE